MTAEELTAKKAKVATARKTLSDKKPKASAVDKPKASVVKKPGIKVTAVKGVDVPFSSKVEGKNMSTKEERRFAVMTIIIVVQFLVILVLIIALTMGFSGTNNTQGNTAKQATTQKSSSNIKKYASKIEPSDENGNIGDHVIGKEGSKATVIWYFDMQCPACASIMPLFNRIVSEYGDRAEIIVRYYLISSHEYARPASHAVEAAAKQGYYLEMMKAVFSYRSDWAYVSSDELLYERLADTFMTASEGKGNRSQFMTDMNDANIAKKVSFDHNLGVSDEINATPTIIVNGRDLDFGNSSESVETLVRNSIEEALK